MAPAPKTKKLLKELLRLKLAVAASDTRAAKFDAAVRADHPKRLHWVVIQHKEGTQYVFRYAFLVHDPKDARFVWVFTEHNGYHLFAVDELRVAEELEELPPHEKT